MFLLEQLAQTIEVRPCMKDTFPVEGGGVGRANSNYISGRARSIKSPPSAQYAVTALRE